MDILDRIYIEKLAAEMSPGKVSKVKLGRNERKELEAIEELTPHKLAVIAVDENNYLEII